MSARPPSTPNAKAGLNPLVRLVSNIWFGVSIMVLILVYCSIMSALPQVRGALELTEMEVYRHWAFGLLIALFTVSLVTATVTRVRWNLVNAGVLTVHTGLLVLIVGAVWYFATKVEGDVLLLSPRIQVLGPDGQTLPGGEILAEVGQSWMQFMPAFGGRVRIEVTETRSHGLQSVAAATLRVQLGDEQPRTVVLDTKQHRTAPLSDRLSVRLETYPPVRHFYDDHVPALYYRAVGETQRHVQPIRGLPQYRERYLDEGYVLRDRDGRPVPSKRTWPHINVLGLKIPTGWFEPWRLPIRIDTPELPFDVQITGFVPYIARTRTRVLEDGPAENPAVRLELRAGQNSVSRWLLANDPVRSVLDTAIPFEFYWVRSEQERQDLLRPLAGPHELLVEVRDPPVRKVYPIEEGQQIQVEGTPYVLTIRRLTPSWPLMTPGYEGARSAVASVDVSNGRLRYNRTVIERFPHLSQDIDEKGKRHREGPYDPNLTLRYRSARQGRVLIVAGPDLEPVIGVIDEKGAVQRFQAPVGRRQALHLGDTHVDVRLGRLVRNARETIEPVIETLDRRRPNIAARSMSAVRLRLVGRGPLAGWSESRWCLFSMYPDTEDARPLIVRPPGSDAEYELLYSRLAHDLGGLLAGRKLSVKFFPGRRSVESWRSDFLALPDGRDEPTPAVVQTNQTFTLGRWTLFQSGAAQDHWSYTILGVGNRNGIYTMLLGCVLITLGCLYAFYLKPVLRRRQQQRALARSQPEAGLPRRRARARPELAEVHS